MLDLKISVIIPFYNAREYVTQAVESALMQPETGEVLLIEDDSPDGGIEICQNLAKKYSTVRLLRHPDGKNHGASASRNLGIKNAVFPYVAFLDADDYYLADRFHTTAEIFDKYPNADGVYEAVTTIFQNEMAKEMFGSLKNKEIITINKKIKPEQLFEELMNGHTGSIHLNGLSLHKSIFDKIGLFSVELRLHQDTELFYRLCAKGNLFPGEIENPVAIQRIHQQNRITYQLADRRRLYTTRILMWRSLIEWGKSNFTQRQRKLVLFRFLAHLKIIDHFPDFSLKDYWISRRKMLGLAFEFPELLVNKYFWKLVLPLKN